MNNPLPKLNSAVYEVTLPSNGKKVKYRPFLVKEYRALLTAREDNNQTTNVATIKALLDSCTFGKLDIDNLAMVDVEYLILKLRCKSIGEVVELYGKCSCGEKTPIEIDLEQVSVKAEKINYIIKLTDTIAVKMMFPTTKVLEDSIATKDQFELIASCIQQIYSGDDVFEAKDLKKDYIMEFLESLNQKQFKLLVEFIDAQPKLRHTVTFECKTCQNKNTVVMEGIDDFFI